MWRICNAIRALIRKDDGGSSAAPMRGAGGARSVGHINKRLLFLLLVTGLILLALGGWTVQGLRWAVTGGFVPRGLAPEAA